MLRYYILGFHEVKAYLAKIMVKNTIEKNKKMIINSMF